MNIPDSAFWPQGVPRNYDELLTQYSRFISSLLARYNKVGRDMEDLHQHIFAKLMESDVIGSFVAHLRKNVPDQVTFEEALTMVGCTREQWKTARWYHHRGRNMATQHKRNITWFPEPVSPDMKPLSRTAQYWREDIAKLILLGYFDESKLKPSTLPQTVIPSPKHFQRYLAMAIHNHYANWLRHYGRHHKERPVSMPRDEEFTSWEATLPSPEEVNVKNRDAVLDVALRVERVLKRYTTTDKEATGRIMGAMDSGYTLKEALEQLALPTLRVRKIVQAVQAALA